MAAKREAAKTNMAELHDDDNGRDQVYEEIEEPEGTQGNGEEKKTPVKVPLSSTVPIVMPSLPMKRKLLIECASAGDNDFADLEGDSGAVGRVALRKSSDDGQGSTSLAFDLKGIMYDATFVPSVSIMVINRSAEEAKVEAVFNNFVRLEERAGQEDILVRPS